MSCDFIGCDKRQYAFGLCEEHGDLNIIPTEMGEPTKEEALQHEVDDLKESLKSNAILVKALEKQVEELQELVSFYKAIIRKLTK